MVFHGGKMKKLFTLFALIGIMLNVESYACNEEGTTGIVEDNNLNISMFDKQNKDMSEEVFNKVIDQVETVYAPIVSEMGGKLKVVRKWSDGTVNAYAQRQGTTYLVSMFGGLARHATITPDGLALVVCHEIGHHIGGAPKKAGSMGGAWASNEGQADYFATLKCLRKAWLSDDNKAIVDAMEVPEFLKTSCASKFQDESEYYICVRGGMAGDSVANLFAALRNIAKPQFNTPDARRVASTDHNHPAAQCRMDTYFQGALCTVDHREDVSQKDEAKGTCYAADGATDGLRPLCWFKPARM